MSEPVFNLEDFNKYREDNRREVKAAKGGLPQSLWDSYSSMANTYGGIIICGVRERGDGSWYTTGMKDVEKLKKEFWNQINNRNKVSINLLHDSDVQSYQVDDDVILVINVPAADREEKPVYINGDMFKGTFKRNNEGDYHCTESEVRAMLRDQTRRTMDMKVLEKMKISDLDQESIRNYRSWFDSRHEDHPWSKYDDEQFLERVGAASDDTEDGKVHPTCAGLLMFGQEFRITREYPAYFLDYRDHADASVRWTDRVQSQSADWSGNVFDFFVTVSRKLVRLLNVPFRLVDMERVDETPAHNAVREALVNCLVNADYFLPRGVVIDSYPDRIVLKNPGTIIVGKRQMLKGGDSEPRNSNIMKMFNLLGFGEHAGSGVPDIYAAWDWAGYKEPSIEERFGEDGPSKTMFILPLTERDHALSEKRQEKGQEKRPETDHNKSEEIEIRVAAVLEKIREDNSITMSEIARQLDISPKKVRHAIDILKEQGTIEREGSDRKGRWKILTDEK